MYLNTPEEFRQACEFKHTQNKPNLFKKVNVDKNTADRFVKDGATIAGFRPLNGRIKDEENL
jgi:hypothetical protein